MPADDVELDEVQINSIRELDGPGYDTLRELTALFSTSSLSAVPVMREALQKNDLTTLKRNAHSLKGSSASLGAVAVSRLCATIEKSVLDNRLAELPALFDELSQRISRTTDALNRILSS